MKGQNFRLKIKETESGTYKAIAGATSCQVSVEAQLSETSTKDSTGDWSDQECVGKSWSGSVDALILGTDNAAITGLSALSLVGQTVWVEFIETTGEKNRADASTGTKYTGTAIVQSISQTHQNKQTSSWSMSFTGVGALTSGSISGDTD